MSWPTLRKLACGWTLPFAWAVAEATCWPIMPDAVLVPLAAAQPGRWWRLALAAAAGSTFGGTLSYAVARVVPSRPLLTQLPLVRPRMVSTADHWLAEEGPPALRRQPLSGIPFKVFALLAGERRLPLLPFLAWALLARGSRFLAVSALSALAGRRFGSPVRRYPGPLLLLWSIAFLLGLRRTVRRWE